VLWISGDTVLYRGIHEVADRLDVGTAILHLGAVRFPITGPVHYSLTGRDGLEVIRLYAANLGRRVLIRVGV
jgi:hypothetical protein